MSGLEIVGLVSGIIPLLQLASDATKALKKRLEDCRLNTRNIAHIENTLNTISQHLQQLLRQYGDHQPCIPPENASIVETDFNDLAATLIQVTEKFASVSQHDQSHSSRRRDLLNRLNLIFSNKKISVCNDIITQLDTASNRLRHINQLLVTVTNMQSISKTQDDIIDQLQSLGKWKNITFDGQDAYTPSFYVPTNPRLAKECLDYVSVDSDGNALTLEGKLKAHLLHLINERHQSQDILPIVGAVGMSGTGKTCALRGLKTEKDLRELFQDGILFMFCGSSASVEDIKQSLCSLVSQTGGRALSQEMKGISGENAIDAIIEKVSAWFKHRKCLFLVDDICDTTVTGSGLLSKLSTVVENCDTTSGLVYTTKEERIDTFDASVRFECLSPDSPTCCNILARAAGFSQEQIHQADQGQAFDMILDHCKGLKMALVVAGTEIRLRAARCEEHKEQAWERYAIALEGCPRQLLTQDHGEYRSLYYQFSVSLQRLASQENHKLSFPIPCGIEDLFQALCVAEKGVVLHDSMLYRLWGLESEHQAREVSKLFADSSLVETTFEFVDGRYSEGIMMHDLVHDYASHLADQNYVDSNWIKGWEVWGLRLVERYFGTGADVVSNSSSFVEWWKNDDVSRHYDSQIHLQAVILRIVRGSQIRNGPSLLKHYYQGVDRFFNRSESAETTSVGVCFTLRKSTVVEMHEFMTILARERKVGLSDLTIRMLVFAALLCVRIDRLLESSHTANEIAESHYNSLCIDADVIRQGHGRHVDITPPSSVEQPPGEYLLDYVYVMPKHLGEYLQSSVALNWIFYGNCFEDSGMDDDELYRMFGVPLTFEKLKAEGIEGNFWHFQKFCIPGRFRVVDNPGFYVDKGDYRCILTSFFECDYDPSSIRLDRSFVRNLHLHLHEVITNDANILSHRKKIAIAETWFETPPGLLRYARTNTE